MSNIIFQAIYFFLPAYFANMAPILFKWVPVLNRPVSEKLLGKNKTYRGYLVAVISGAIIFWIQQLLYNNGFTSLAIIDYSGFSVLLGALMGFGAIFGDSIKSYFKRQYGIAPGKSWPVWDQIDFVIGGLLFTFLMYVPPVEVAVVLIIVSPILHVLINYLGYLMKVKKNKF